MEPLYKDSDGIKEKTTVGNPGGSSFRRKETKIPRGGSEGWVTPPQLGGRKKNNKYKRGFCPRV